MNKNKKKNLLKAIELFMVIVILVGAFGIEKVSLKVIKTSSNLAVLNDNISFYNEQPVKTDEMTKKAEEYIRIRNEQFYNSENNLVRVYSNANVFVKIIIAIIAFALIVLTPLAIFLQICVYYSYKRKLKRKKQKTQKESNLL